MTQFTDKVAIVTGGASGIGLALTTELVRQGAKKVIVADINPDSVANSGGKVQAVRVDVADADQVQALVDQVVKEYGRLDYMFNNAGIAIIGEVCNMTLEHWNRIIDVNLRGVINGVMAAYPVMIKQGYGHIINTASLGGLISAPILTAYATTKHAVVALSLGLRSEAFGYGVKVSVICPSYVNTNIVKAGTYLNSNEQAVMAMVPVKSMPVDQAAHFILERVKRNKAFIIMPKHAYFLWWLQRLSPAFILFFGRQMANSFRKVQSKSSKQL